MRQATDAFAVLTAAVAAAAGVNRVIKHQHFLSDVVAGSLLGHLVAVLVLRGRRARRLWRCETVDTGGVPP